MTSTTEPSAGRGRLAIAVVLLAIIVVAIGVAISMMRNRSAQRTFATPEEAVQTLAAVVKAGDLEGMMAIFGPDSRELVNSSDAATARRNQEVFTVAMTEGWHLADERPDEKTLVVGYEEWPFPVPIVKDGGRWQFDTAAGKEEVLDRRVGRNELAVIEICRTYVRAQQRYARDGHDGKPAGLYAQSFRSTPGTQSGLFWIAAPGQRRSPLGDLVADAAAEGRIPKPGTAPGTPFHGYYFRILTAQGAAAPGGARSYIVNGDMTGGFALVAWPAYYGQSGVMSFNVGADGVVYESDLGADTDRAARAMTDYNPDEKWTRVEPGS